MKRLYAIVGLILLLSGAAFAQSSDTPAPATPTTATFDIADVHTSPRTANAFFQPNALRGGRYVLHNANMVDLISTAYGVDADKVLGGPSWLERDLFDVIAKAPATTSPETVKLMLQALLADRFKLVVHPDSKPLPIFALTVGKGKPKLAASDGSGTPGCVPRIDPPNPTPGVFPLLIATCHNMTMETFAQTIHQYAGGYLTNPVVDSTGLKGAWDFEIKWSPRGGLAQAGADGISIFDAVDKQLGLKLEPQKSSLPVIMVDSVNEKPTDNPPGVVTTLPTPPPAEFEVAIIKPSMPDEQLTLRIDPGGQVNIQNVTLKFLIAFCWNLNFNDNDAIVGAPKWLDSDHYDIVAKPSTDGSTSGEQIDFDALRQMLQALVVERFKMVSHMENRPLSAYTLVADKPKLTKADPLNRTKCKEGPGADGKDPRIANPVLARLITCQNMNMTQFAEQLQTLAPGYIYAPVLDSTGIEGNWDITVSFSPNNQGQAGAPGAPPAAGAVPTASDPSGAITLFDAINKQLGLKMEKQKRPLPVLVIDHIDQKPTDN